MSPSHQGAACGGVTPCDATQGSACASSTCASLAATYAAGLLEASTCDPRAADPCGAQRPIAVYEVAGQRTTLTGLCDVANSGYVDPAHTAAIDDALARHRAAGCTVGSCPGPAPHAPACRDEGLGFAICE